MAADLVAIVAAMTAAITATRPISAAKVSHYHINCNCWSLFCGLYKYSFCRLQKLRNIITHIVLPFSRNTNIQMFVLIACN